MKLRFYMYGECIFSVSKLKAMPKGMAEKEINITIDDAIFASIRVNTDTTQQLMRKLHRYSNNGSKLDVMNADILLMTVK